MTNKYPTEYGPFWVCHLTPEQHARTCGYWYTVTTGCTAHTAFRTRAALDAWLSIHGLTLDRELGESPDSIKLEGFYKEISYMDFEAFQAVEGVPILQMSNGTHTLGKVTTDDKGICTTHYCNVNVKQRPAYDWRIARKLVDSGDYTPPTHHMGQVVGAMTQAQYNKQTRGFE